MVGGVVVFTVTVTGEDVALVHAPTLQMAVYEVVADGDTTILAPLTPFDHVTVPSHTAVSVAVSPEQIAGLFTDTTGAVGVSTAML